ncbi:MAG: hypothetical protein J2P48_13830 [Alphaproteobacteria bacterium]|nr:hypothetical protein [Alphaproteobacteria bacterium]
MWPLLIVAVFQSAALAPLAPLGDTLAIATAAPERSNNCVRQGLHYGWLRGAGSAAFTAGSILSGQAIRLSGMPAAVWLNAGLLAAAALAALRVPALLPRRDACPYSAAGEQTPRVSALLRLSHFRRSPDRGVDPR